MIILVLSDVKSFAGRFAYSALCEVQGVSCIRPSPPRFGARLDFLVPTPLQPSVAQLGCCRRYTKRVETIYSS